MTELKPLKPGKLIKIVESLGFKLVHIKGSHHVFKHIDGRCIVIPFHSNKSIGVGLLNSMIKRELKISREEFQNFL